MTDYIRNIVKNQTVTPPATLIRGATVLSMDESIGNIERGDVLITGSTITAVGKNLDVQGAHIIDATNMIAMPGMVDSHRHSWTAAPHQPECNLPGRLQQCHALFVCEILSPV